MQSCSKCKTLQPVAEYRLRRGKPRSICKTCERLYQREYYWKNPEKARAKSRKSMQKQRENPERRQEMLVQQRAYYHKKAKYREREYLQEIKTERPWEWRARNTKRNVSAKITEEWLRDKFNLQNGRCALSGRPITVATFHVDHIIPRARGGGAELDNLRLVCPEANMAKSQLTDDELFCLCEEILATRSHEMLGRAIMEASHAA